MSAACIIIFYLLLRQMQVTPQHALFGVALLALNPMYVYLSYSFMTDITFMAFMLSSCLCYLRGNQKYAEGVERNALLWLLLGGVMAAIAHLTRQFGLLLLPAALGYLWWSKRWTWRRAAAIAAIPVAVLLTYMLWERTQPMRLVDILVGGLMQFPVKHPSEYMLRRLQADVLMIPALGLSLLPLVRVPRRLFLSGLLLTLIIIFQVKSREFYGSTFPLPGSIVDRTGFIMLFYDAAPIWTEWLWLLLGILGSLSISLHLVAYAEQIVNCLRSNKPWRQRAVDPALLLYFLAFLLLASTQVSIFLVDRYLLPILPLLIIAGLRSLRRPEIVGRCSWRWALIIPVALFAIIGQRDYMAHSSARWQAAEQLVLQGARHEQIDAGFEWAGWHSYEAGASYIREKQDFTHAGFPPNAVLDSAFAVGDSTRSNYVEVGSLPYASWLEGGRIRRVLLLKRK